MREARTFARFELVPPNLKAKPISPSKLRNLTWRDRAYASRCSGEKEISIANGKGFSSDLEEFIRKNAHLFSDPFLANFTLHAETEFHFEISGEVRNWNPGANDSGAGKDFRDLPGMARLFKLCLDVPERQVDPQRDGVDFRISVPEADSCDDFAFGMNLATVLGQSHGTGFRDGAQ
jgi:hypothetical protein